MASGRLRLYSYIVTHDTGFSPNPFFGYCTLACCKPAIRREAQVGDWIVGLSPKAEGNRIVYFMRVDKNLAYGQYWADPRFRKKRPVHGEEFVRKRGDNIYEPMPGGGYRQLLSSHMEKDKAHDLGGRYVLVSETFAYFGSRAVKSPPGSESLVAQWGHRCRFPDETVAMFQKYAESVRHGIHGSPGSWKRDDGSWREGCDG